MPEIILKGRLNGVQRNRLKGLFDMMYSPTELAEEIGINKHQFYYVYIHLDCPHERDSRNRILINGKAFAEWYSKVYVKIHLKPNEIFCLTCKKPVEIFKPIEKNKGSLVYLLCTCPNCGRTISKILNEKRGENGQ